MSILQVYGRVLRLLGSEKRLAWFLAVGNVLLAIALFAEPILFGRIIDALSKAQAATSNRRSRNSSKKSAASASGSNRSSPTS